MVVEQGCVLHLIDTVRGPGHIRPPFLGEGLLQILCFVLVPPPQRLLQELYALQPLQPPSTPTVVTILKIWLNFS